jgi:hypothetical protein
MTAFAPLLLVLAAAAAEPAATPAVEPPASAEPVPATATEPAAPGVPTPAVIEKLGYGDRLFLAGDHRNALFAYQDAVYMEPKYATARVRLGRAYLALRYPAHALVQAEAALALDPASTEAQELRDAARSAPPRPAAPTGAGVASPGASPSPAPVRSAPRIFRLTPEPSVAQPSASSAAGPPAHDAR